MSNFYVSMIFTGILLILASLGWVAFEKKSSFSYMNRLEEKKKDMVSIINDAELMIEELNKFSDYIVTQMDAKNAELRENLNKADEEIRQIRSGIPGQPAEKAEISEEIAETDKNTAEAINSAPPVMLANGNEIFEHIHSRASQYTKQGTRKNEKAVSVNNRYTEVLRLSTDGLNDTEIAKRLNMGKGEIQLILELNKS